MIEQAFRFGPFQLSRERRILLEDGRPVRLGSRALDILIALVERAGEIVGKDELVARAWPDTFVEEGNLRVHVNAVRKALRDGHNGARYIANVPGRGYSFVAPLARVEQALGAPSPTAQPADNLPTSLTSVIGRDAELEALAAQVARRRFATIVGPGGIGKTTLALAVAGKSIDSYEHRACFVDLAMVGDAAHVAGAIASALKLPVVSENPMPVVAAFLKQRRMLLVLDNCEPVVEAAAAAAEQILKAAPGVHILATSREPLRAAGEFVYRLAALDIPATATVPTAREALLFPAVQLLVERAGIALSDEDAPLAIDICRRLDGLPLAIELAAATVELFGLRGLAERLDDRFSLLTRGRRTAAGRHQTLRATLDWSYDMLSAREQWVLPRLAVFKGPFTVGAANVVAIGAQFGQAKSLDIVSDLAAKSLVAVDLTNGNVQCRLLDSTREYALEKLKESGDFDEIARRHADYFRKLLEAAETAWRSPLSPEQSAAYASQIDNLRAALDWAFSPTGDRELGIALTVAAVPLWTYFSLLDECSARVQRALSATSETDANQRQVMQLCVALGTSLMFAEGSPQAQVAAWTRAYDVAEQSGDLEHQLRALWGLWIGRYALHDYAGALAVADKLARLSATTASMLQRTFGDYALGMTMHTLGDHAKARAHFESALEKYRRPADRSDLTGFQTDRLVVGRSWRAQILWVQGFPEQALRLAESNIADARTLDHRPSLYYSALFGCPIALLAGEFDAADRFAKIVSDISITPAWTTWAECYKAVLMIERGDADGPRALRAALSGLPKSAYRIRYTWFLGVLARGLREAGEIEQASEAIDEALEIGERHGERWCLSECIRIKGDILAAHDAGARAEALLLRSLEIAREQSALSWELRTATSLAQLRQRQGRQRQAFELLSPVYDRFAEGFETRDLVQARTLLRELAR